jgi:hypothetical protein
MAIALADDYHGLALAVLIAGEATVAAVLAHIGGFHISAKIAAVDLASFVLAAELRTVSSILLP